jgi:hypothetical protein
MRALGEAIESWEDAEEDQKAPFAASVRRLASGVHIVASAVAFVSFSVPVWRLLTLSRGKEKVNTRFWAHSGRDTPTESKVRLEARDRARKRPLAEESPAEAPSPRKKVRFVPI